MANVEHSSLTGSALHEPKAISTANGGETYVANGSGSGVWKPIHRHLGVGTSFDATGPTFAYTLSTDIAEKFLSPTTTTSHTTGFTVQTSPNLRFLYTDSTVITGYVSLNMSATQTIGGLKHVEWLLLKNGTELVGSRIIRTISTGTWVSVSLDSLISLAQNDYLEIKTKADVDSTVVDYADISLTIIGMSA